MSENLGPILFPKNLLLRGWYSYSEIVMRLDIQERICLAR